MPSAGEASADHDGNHAAAETVGKLSVPMSFSGELFGLLSFRISGRPGGGTGNPKAQVLSVGLE